MRVAFYAPLKPIDHPVPSGDRRMARLLVHALQSLGHDVLPTCRLRSFDREGDARRQQRLAMLGQRCAARVAERLSATPPAVWLTYHAYHKAPDWLGPALSGHFDSAYVLIEASFAPKQQGGAWAQGHAHMAHCLNKADVVLAIAQRDRAGLTPCMRSDAALNMLKPFLVLPDRTCRPKPRRTVPRILTVAMMRSDVKQHSYGMSIDALAEIRDQPWHWHVVGDGPARAQIEEDAKARLGPERFTMVGALEGEALHAAYSEADLFFWPGLNEAYGMVFLEAQAAGLAVIAGREGGIPDVVADGRTGLLREATASELAAGLRCLLSDPDRRDMMGRAAQAYVQADHALPQACRRLDAALNHARSIHHSARKRQAVPCHG